MLLLRTLHGLPRSTASEFHRFRADLRVLRDGFPISLSSVSLILSSLHEPRPRSNITSQTPSYLSVWVQISPSLKYPPLLPQPTKASAATFSWSHWECYLLPLACLATSTRSKFSLSWRTWHFAWTPLMVFSLFSSVYELLFFLLGNLTLSFITLVSPNSALYIVIA